MMPLTMVNEGELGVVARVGGKDDTRRFLENLGIVEGTKISVVKTINGNMILNVRNSRVAIGKEMANKIMVA